VEAFMDERTIRNVIWGVAGLVLGSLGTVAVLAFAAPGLVVQEHRSPYGLTATVQTIVTNATNRGWRVSKIYDFREALDRPAEPKLAPIQVIELCQRDYARDLLKSGKNRFVAAMMPCAVAVYEKEDGTVYVASMNSALMGRLFGGEIRTIMSRVARDDAEILRFLARQ
jgi:uncharacterized protein (DUF302 family)